VGDTIHSKNSVSGTQPAAQQLSRRAFLGACAGVLVLRPLFASSVWQTPDAVSLKVSSQVELESSDGRLMEGFRWAKNQALAYAFTGDPVGPWYEAALPGRQAFCMRDTSHQSTGAQILGLAEFNENMLRKFAENISASKDWCSYWEINRNNVPAPVDYVRDHDFWYNLPANFDVLDACYRQFLWTGNNAYLDPVFMNFYTRTATDYVKKWDINGDGLLEHFPEYGHRGIASYEEQNIAQTRVGADLVATQYRAYRDFASIQLLKGEKELANEFTAKAEHLKSIYNADWWNESQGSFFAFIGSDGQYHADLQHGSAGNVSFSLYCRLIDPGRKTEAALAEIKQRFSPDNNSAGVEARSYVPEILYSYGQAEPAYRALLGLMDPSLKRREYPEVSFAVVGACATGLMGLAANATSNLVETFPQLTGTEWVHLKHVPVFDNQVSIQHIGNRTTMLTNESGRKVQWRASLPGRFEKLRVNERDIYSKIGKRLGGMLETWTVIEVGPGQKHTVEASS
jgi:Bacterial alpha-L-rhamnosidase 6 hairpin glycosidase domain